jgi:hypothetical protein
MDIRLASVVAPLPMTLMALSLCACIARNAPPDKSPSTVPAQAPLSPIRPAAPMGPAFATPAPMTTSESPMALLGYVPMHASVVVATHDGEAVLLVDEKEAAALPIFIGSTEATSSAATSGLSPTICSTP